MIARDDFPHPIEVIEHAWIPMPDGRRLAARIWRPVDAHSRPVPAILEYLPYRKNDLTAERDATMQPYRAGFGYAAVRVDLAGAGDSDGLMEDEYLPQELEDGAAVIAWLAEQPWCDGKVGMVGISWGGFNGLQIAAMRPPALRAVVTLCSTDDRYADDVHYMGGCLLGEQLSWASIMFARNALPPDPAVVGERWREMWLERLEGSGLWLEKWLRHQRRDAYWKHGSICEDWSRVTVPVYAVSGWADGYFRSVFRLLENLPGPKKGLIGPWSHKYPHIGVPGPAIGWLAEEIRWWDHWLKGIDDGVMDEPPLRLWLQEPSPAHLRGRDRPGRWIAEPAWPSPQIERARWSLGANGALIEGEPRDRGIVEHVSPADVGMAAGKWFGTGAPGNEPGDQRRDDAASLTFDGEPLNEPLDLVGEPVLELTVAIDRPWGQIAARLCALDPEGRSERLSFGVLNLAHRDGHEQPVAMAPGAESRIRLPLRHLARRIAPGSSLRLAISTSYFPMIWTAPERFRLRVRLDDAALRLPVRRPSPIDARLSAFRPAEGAPPLAKTALEEPEFVWRVIEDAGSGESRLEAREGAGAFRIEANGETVRLVGRESYAVRPEDPASARGETAWESVIERGDWSTRCFTETVLRANGEAFSIEARLRAHEGDALAFERAWSLEIPRDGL